MSESVSSSDKITISFSGHDTFPLRQGWLEKAYQLVNNKQEKPFLSDDAIVKLGVGKNMVNAIKHWALATNFIEKNGNNLVTSNYAKQLLDKDVDPYLENIGTMWKIHYELCKKISNTTVYWIFSHLNNPTFNRDDLEQKLREFALDNDPNSGLKSIKTDINVILAMYCRARDKKVAKSNKRVPEDFIASPLTDLNLIRRIGDNLYTLNTGLKKTLPQGLFISTVVDFWENRDIRNSLLSGGTERTQSIKVDSLLYDPFSPGRLFVLSEHELKDRLHDIEIQTNGALTQNDSAGVPQIFKNKNKYNADRLKTKWSEK